MSSPTALALSGVALMVAFGATYVAGHQYGKVAGRIEVQSKWNAEKAEQDAKARQASEDARAEEQRRTAAQKEITDAAQRQITQARADAAAAVGAADRLRQRAAALAAAADRGGAVDPVSTSGGETAAGTGLVLADVLGRADGRAGELAAAYDAARAAGVACEASYDALAPAGGR